MTDRRNPSPKGAFDTTSNGDETTGFDTSARFPCCWRVFVHGLCRSRDERNADPFVFAFG